MDIVTLDSRRPDCRETARARRERALVAIGDLNRPADELGFSRAEAHRRLARALRAVAGDCPLTADLMLEIAAAQETSAARLDELDARPR